MDDGKFGIVIDLGPSPAFKQPWAEHRDGIEDTRAFLGEKRGIGHRVEPGQRAELPSLPTTVRVHLLAISSNQARPTSPKSRTS